MGDAGYEDAYVCADGTWRYVCEEGHHIVTSTQPDLFFCPAEVSLVEGQVVPRPTEGHRVCGADVLYREVEVGEPPVTDSSGPWCFQGQTLGGRGCGAGAAEAPTPLAARPFAAVPPEPRHKRHSSTVRTTDTTPTGTARYTATNWK